MSETVPPPQIVTPNPDFEAMAERRATRLCVAAEPHGLGVTPCALHLHEARRELVIQYQQQEYGS